VVDIDIEIDAVPGMGFQGVTRQRRLITLISSQFAYCTQNISGHTPHSAARSRKRRVAIMILQPAEENRVKPT
jgi:hypothetical protein